MVHSFQTEHKKKGYMWTDGCRLGNEHEGLVGLGLGLGLGLGEGITGRDTPGKK